MKKLMVMITLAGILLLAAIASDARAMGFGQGKGMWGGRGGGPCAEGVGPGMAGLGLTTEQLTKMNELRAAHLKDVAPLRDKMINKNSELRLLWLQASPDRDRISAAQKEMRALRDKMQDAMTSFRLDMLKVLTPEQQTRVQAARAGRGFGPGFDDECGGEGMNRGMMHPGWHGGSQRGRGGF